MERLAFDSNGVLINYYKFGGGERSIIFVHGNSENGLMFKDIAEKLAAENFTVYLTDTRGHGLSANVERLNYSDFADDLAMLIEHENMVSPFLFGFSDGGIAGLILAARYPDILGKLLVAGINLTPRGLKRYVNLAIRFGFFITHSDKLRLMFTQPDIDESMLAKITAPTIVYHASHDIVLLSHSKTAAEKVQNGKLITVNGEKHHTYVVDNEKLYNLLVMELK